MTLSHLCPGQLVDYFRLLECVGDVGYGIGHFLDHAVRILPSAAARACLSRSPVSSKHSVLSYCA